MASGAVSAPNSVGTGLEQVFDYSSDMDQPKLVALQRSTAMLQPGTTVPLRREELLELLEEVTATRALLSRLGADLKTVARRAPG